MLGETLISARLDKLERRLQARKRSEVRKWVVGDLEQNELDSDPVVDEPKRGEWHGPRERGGFHNRRLLGRRKNNHGNQGFRNIKIKFLKFQGTNAEDIFQWELNMTQNISFMVMISLKRKR